MKPREQKCASGGHAANHNSNCENSEIFFDRLKKERGEAGGEKKISINRVQLQSEIKTKKCEPDIEHPKDKIEP